MLDCGHAESPHSEYTRGYGEDSEGKKYCYDCCHARDLESIQRAEPFTGYLTRGQGGSKWVVSNWPGQKLLTVTQHWSMLLFSGPIGMERKIYHIRAVDEQGRAWYGRGMGEGMYCQMRPTKATMAAVKGSQS